MKALRVLLALFSFIAISGVAAQDGKAIYAARCAACHDHPQEQTPSRELLSNRSQDSIVAALTTGLMKSMAAGLSATDIEAAASYLVSQRTQQAKAPQLSNPDVLANICSRPVPLFSITPESWNGWSPDPENSRFHLQSKLRRSDLSKLKPKWVFAYPGGGVYGPPSAAGGRIFIGTKTGSVLSLDAATGCTYWATAAGPPVKTAIVVGAIANNRFAAYYGDGDGLVHAVDVETGKPIWNAAPETHPLAGISGSFKLQGGRLYVPFATIRESGAAMQSKSCCTLRGSVAVLDAITGRTIWQQHTIEDIPQPFKLNAANMLMFGPAGASVWSPPTLDLVRGTLYVTTGQSRTDITEQGSDSLIAYELNRGARLWSMQATRNDSWTGGCVLDKPAPHCPTQLGPDVDFGSPALLRTLANGKRVLIAAQKSGMVHAVDPDANGAVVWRVNLAKDANTPPGVVLRDRENPGVVFGMAADAEKLYAAIADPGKEKGHVPLGVYALELTTGRIVWRAPGKPVPACSWGEAGCTGAQRTAVTVIPGVVFAGSANGHLYAYDADNGKVIWDVDTAKTYQAVNGVIAQGGAVEGNATIVADRSLYVMSGYASYGGGYGNALIAFSVGGAAN